MMFYCPNTTHCIAIRINMFGKAKFHNFLVWFEQFTWNTNLILSYLISLSVNQHEQAAILKIWSSNALKFGLIGATLDWKIIFQITNFYLTTIKTNTNMLFLNFSATTFFYQMLFIFLNNSNHLSNTYESLPVWTLLMNSCFTIQQNQKNILKKYVKRRTACIWGQRRKRKPYYINFKKKHSYPTVPDTRWLSY